MNVATVPKPVDDANDGPWTLSRGWSWTTVGRIATLRGEKVNPRIQPTLPFVGMDDIEPEGTSIAQTRPFGSMKSAGNRFRTGDVLYGRLRPYLNKTAVATHDGACSGELLAICPSIAVDSRYLQFFMHARRFVNTAMGTVSGDRPRIDFATIAGFDFPLAPLAEQRRIVARVDALYAEIAEGEAALAEARKGLDIFRRAVLKAASVGELTKDWRAANPIAESGHDLLTRIAKDQAGAPKTRTRRVVEAPPQDTSRLPILPEGWDWATLEQVGQIISGQTPTGIEKLVQTSGEIPWFKVSSMNDAGADGILVNSQWYLSGAEAKRIGLHVVPVDAICFPKRGGSILTNKKRRLGVPGALDLNVMAYVPHHELREFAWFYFMNLDLKRIFDGSNVPQINYGDIAYLPIALPPPREAAEILRRVSDALSASADTLAILDAEAADAARLKQSILKAAFEGRLEPQDTADEPASALLARLGRNTSATRARRGRAKSRL